MGWIHKLYETYENNAHMAGKMVKGETALAPVAHILANAQLEITISEDGDFLYAEEVPKEERSTFIPATEESGGRASGIAPHPLCDTLSYVAGDYNQYVKEGTKEYTLTQNKYTAYLKQLETWAKSEDTHPKVTAVYQYCLKKRIISDLHQCGLVKIDDKNRLTTDKVAGNPYEKCLVRWRVHGREASGEPTATWEDTKLFDCFIAFTGHANEQGAKDLCYVTGQESVMARNHPKGIIAASYGAKLLSANDMSGFTFRGRFLEPGEAYGVGYEVTQKAHNALRWLVANQGVFYGGRTFLCWNPKGKKVPFLQKNILEDEDEMQEEAIPYTMPIYRKRFIKAINGYGNQLDDNDDIVIIALDAATTGRLSITYYNELKASDFIQRLENWYETCCWYYTEFTQDKKPYQLVKTPEIRQIVNYAFGTERGTEKGKYVDTDERIMKQQSERVLHCILNGALIPEDLVRAIVIRASNPLAYSRTNRERILSTACALLNKKYYSKEREDERMKLDTNDQDRSYLFGRLLAVTEKVERRACPDIERDPNAIRYQNVFQQYPMHTWRMLDEAIRPYYAKLDEKTKRFYQDLTGEILSTFKEEDKPVMNMNLDDTYLFGYYLQRKELNTYNTINDENNINDEKQEEK